MTCFSSIKTRVLFQERVFDGRGAIARTTDAGVNWSTLFFDQAIEGVAFPTPTSGFAVGAVGRILHTTDAGTTWTDQTSGSSANLHDISFASDALTGITVGDGGTILWTTNGGEPSPTPSPTPTATPTPTPNCNTDSKACADTKISSKPETSPDSSAVGALTINRNLTDEIHIQLSIRLF